MIRISDSRMSGTSYGTVVLHACPEAACGGVLAVVRNGDEVCLDVAARSLEVSLSSTEIERRMNQYRPLVQQHLRGYPRLFIDHVLQADEGCDFDFLRPNTPEALKFVAPVIGRS